MKVPSLSSDPLYSNYNAINPYVYKELPLLWEISYIIKFNLKRGWKTIDALRTEFCKNKTKAKCIEKKKEKEKCTEMLSSFQIF